MLSTVARSEIVTQPTTEPITIHEAKKQLEIGSDDSFHDVDIYRHIVAAREQFEHDTSEVFISRQLRLRMNCFHEFRFNERPVTAIDSIVYYDSGNTSQTLATSVYQLDTATSSMRLAYDQLWPAYTGRWDAVTITYTAGSHADSTTVPSVAKSAMLLLVGYYFENRGDGDRPNDMAAYEALVRKFMRSSYP